MTNVVAKSIQKLAFNNLEYTLTEYPFNFYFLENGSCRLCKTCKLQEDLNCKYPQKMRPSLEATGIDVNDLVNKAFGFNLQWYNRDYFPQYQCVVGGILSNEPEMIKRELSDFYTTNYLAISSKGTRVTKQLLEEIVI
jgi:hypothetical protein